MPVSELIARCTSMQATLAIAESCTGGRIADLITAVPGASAVLIAGIIAYSRDAKINILGIPASILEKHGMVSSATAEAMADRVRIVAHADYAVATTGNLGPGSLEGKECGLVYIAVRSSKRAYSRELHLGGNRAANKHDASLAALMLLAEVLHKETSDE